MRLHRRNSARIAVLFVFAPWAFQALAQAQPRGAIVVSLDGADWNIATDPKDVGVREKWFDVLRPDAAKTRVPWIIEDAFPGYDGVAWYWKRFEPTVNPHKDGRTLLRFWAVDFKADVWLNGKHLGMHEGGETPFLLDATEAIRPGGENLLAVRVLNPCDTPIDGITLAMTPHRNKACHYSAGASYNHGGIVDSVEVLHVPAVRISDMFVRADPHTGIVTVDTTVENTTGRPAKATIGTTVAPASEGESIGHHRSAELLPPGTSVVQTRLTVENPRLWDIDEPNLYRVTQRLQTDESGESFDERSVRTGFREFVFKDGHFRLNGKRLFLKCSHTGNHCPVGLQMPAPEFKDILRKDLVNCKAMGFNAIRFIAGISTRYQLDLADEIGLMVYTEPYSSWCMAPSPRFEEWFDGSLREMILRDRNHPSVVIWGVLNETSAGPVFLQGAKSLELIRSLDPTRLVLLNSGRWDKTGGPGSPPPGLAVWRLEEQTDPCVTFNTSQRRLECWGVVWEPGQLVMHPGPKNEKSVLRFTAPHAGRFQIHLKCADATTGTATTDVHVLHGGKELFAGGINVSGKGPSLEWESAVQIAAGETLDFAVGFGNGHHGGDSTAFDVRIADDQGGAWDGAKDFGEKENPSGPWSYGFLAAGDALDASTFKPYPLLKKPERSDVGTFSNPGTTSWDDSFDDHHPYQRVPHTADVIDFFRHVGKRTYVNLVCSQGGGKPYFPSEYGIGSGVNWPRVLRLFDQHGYPHVEDRAYYQAQYDAFLADFERWNMVTTFGRPEAFFTQSIARMAKERTRGLNAIRANPSIVGYSLTGTVDQGMSGEGLTTTFREFKPGTVDAIADGFAPLRWCTFVEPLSTYTGREITLEAVLANEDALRPGEYPAKARVFGPKNEVLLEHAFVVTIPEGEPPFALPVLNLKWTPKGPAGTHRFVTAFEKGAAATGGEAEFFVFDRDDMPPVEARVVLWGEDDELLQWAGENGITIKPFDMNEPVTNRLLLLAVGVPQGVEPEAAFADLRRRVEEGSSVIFLTAAPLGKKDDPTAYLPLEERGGIAALPEWLYHIDQWAADHPIFEGLQSGGLMDYGYYREIIPTEFFVGLSRPDTAIAGGNDVSWRYSGGLLTAEYRLGKGRMLLNTLWIRRNLGTVPQAERLLRNMLNHMAPPAEE